MVSENELATRIGKLEAEQEIRSLKAAYASLCDAGYPPVPLVAQFTEDGVFDGGERFGVHSGHDELMSYFGAVSKEIVWALHYMVGPSIVVDESLNTAKGTWYLWQPCTLVVGGKQTPIWISGKYADEYRRVEGAWRFAHVKLVLETISDARDNWIDNPFVS